MNKVRVVFTEDGKLLVQCPFNREFNEALRDNNVQRSFNREFKIWTFPGEFAGDVMKLLEDFYGHTE